MGSIKGVKFELGAAQDVEKMAIAVDDLLIQYSKVSDELKQKGKQLDFAYNNVLKQSKELGVDAELLMKEAIKAIGKLKMNKLI